MTVVVVVVMMMMVVVEKVDIEKTGEGDAHSSLVTNNGLSD